MISGSRVAVILCALALLAGACGDDDSDGVGSSGLPATQPPTDDGGATDGSGPDSPDAPAGQPLAIGRVTRTLVDTTRETPRSGDEPGRPERTLETVVYYPAAGDPTGSPVDDAEPARDGGPYPLVVFAHGLGGNTDYPAAFFRAWATAGYVVAAPTFPLSSDSAPAGPDAGDVGNQPGDLSFVIDEILAASEDPDDLLSGLVDGDAIAAAGHSNGGITTYGIAAHDCCRDERLDAVMIFAGVPSPFAGGDYDLSQAPPVLLIHGDQDVQIAYLESVRSINEGFQAPEGLLTIEGGDHGGWFSEDHPAFPSVAQATVAFLDAYLKGDPGAIDRLKASGQPGVTNIEFAAEDEELTIATTVPPELDREASVTPADGLRGGQVVEVSWSGFLPGQVVNVVQCAGEGGEGSDFCDLTKARILEPNPTGDGSVELEIIVGPVGRGNCGPDDPCVIAVNDAGLQEPEATIYLPITFAG